MIAFLPILLAATPVSGDGEALRQPAIRLATATVTIVQLERIAPTETIGTALKTDRQMSQREQKPLIEFF